ncbi:MAG: beta-propeller domain-containing protein [Campylobacterota bacterium]|nr:beta-propeller domain-containing protein [Campylobacterota bacterium]
MRILMVLVLIFGLVYAEKSIEFKKGWQLVGVPSTSEGMSLFNTKEVEIVWSFDGETQSWKAYSPDETLEQKLIEKSIPFLSALESWQAVWVFSKAPWSLHVKDTTLPTEVKNNAITLYEGWNLIQIPQESVVSDSFFGDAVVWKYSENQEWSVNEKSLNFPSIESIAVSEGLWVKSASTREIKVDEALSKLRTFESEAAMLSYIRTMLKLETYHYGYLDGVPEMVTADLSGNESLVTTTPETAKDATSTNLQEIGVDEADILKHDNRYIYSADNRGEKIKVTSFEKIAAQDYSALVEIDMSDKNILAMYLEKNRLSVVSSRAYNYLYVATPVDDVATVRSLPYYGNASQHFTLDVFDVSNVLAISKLESYDIDGNYQESRLINGKLFLISQFYPNIDYEYPKIYVENACSQLDHNEIFGSCMSSMVCEMGDECQVVKECHYGDDYELWNEHSCYQYRYDEKGAWKYDYENPIVKSENLIPSITSGGESTPLVTPSQFYAPNKLDQRANITTISRFDTQSAVRDESISFIGNTHTYYASTTSLYLVSSEYPYYYDFTHYKTQQMIYKFSLGDTMSYKGRGFVEGNMLNQFSMSEKDAYLRVATTMGNSWSNEGTNNSVFTLKENDEKLEIEGALSGLGKEGETIKAVRFMGDRGFVVTFRQTDPLYTLDMSNPLNPTVVGELSIPGFSEYLHVIDENRLLSIGRDADESGRALGLQVSLFDISDYANPQRVQSIQVGGKSTYSEAEHNHKAFAYRASDMIFGLPYTDYSQDYRESFGVYQIDGMSIKTLHTLSTTTPYDWGNSARGLIYDFDDTRKAALFKGSNILSETLK